MRPGLIGARWTRTHTTLKALPLKIGVTIQPLPQNCWTYLLQEFICKQEPEEAGSISRNVLFLAAETGNGDVCKAGPASLTFANGIRWCSA